MATIAKRTNKSNWNYFILCAGAFVILLNSVPALISGQAMQAPPPPPQSENREEAEELKNRGNDYYRDEKFEKAAEQYKKAIEADPTYAFAYNNLGITQYELGKFDESAQNLKKAIELDPEYEKAYNNLGNTYMALTNYGEALENFLKADDLKPDDYQTQVNIGNAYLGLEKYQQSILYYQKAIAIDERNVDPYNNMGVAYLKNGDKENAIQSFHSAIKRDPYNADAYVNLGIAVYDNGFGDLASALEQFNRALTYDKEHILAMYHLSIIYIETGDTQEARKHLNKAISEAPNDPDIKYAMGLYWYKSDRMSDAIRYFEEALLIDEAHEPARQGLLLARSQQ